MINEKFTEFFPIYKRLENEVIKLASSIYFCDEHKSVFSIDIADLIVRCSVEIESIAKEIYRHNTNMELDNTGISFNWMDENWKISKRKIMIHSPYFHFEDMKSLSPFDYKNNSDDDQYSTYNAIKHDRLANLTKANIYTLIRSLGALYILNVYYKDERINLKDDHYAEMFDRTMGSDVFSILVNPCKDLPLLDKDREINPDHCIYVINREPSKYAISIRYKNQFDEVKSISLVRGTEVFQKTAASLIGKSIPPNDYLRILSTITDTSTDLLIGELFNNFRMIKLLGINAYKMKDIFWAELNKSTT